MAHIMAPAGLALAALLLELPWRVTGIMMAAPLDYYQDQAQSLLAAFQEQYGEQISEPQVAAEHSVAPERWSEGAGERGGLSGSRGPSESGETLKDGVSFRGGETLKEGDPLEAGGLLDARRLRLEWVQRCTPRKFGKVLPGELHACAEIARKHGVLLDPVWTLASWQTAQQLVDQSAAQRQGMLDSDAEVPPTEGNERVVVLMTGGGLGLHGLAQRWPADF